MLGSGLEQLIRLGRNMLLARLLLPDVFGTVALVLTVTSLVDSLSQIGIREAVIQSSDANDPDFLSSALFVALVRGAALSAVVWVGAPLAAAFYKRPDLVPMLQVASLSFFFQGAFSVKGYTALKQISTGKWVFVEQLGGVIGVVLSVVLSLWHHDAWGLVIGSTFENLARTVLSYLVFPFKPRLHFDKTKFAAVMTYSRSLIGLPVLTFVYLQADMFAVGRMLNATQVGLYAMAAGLSRIPDMVVARFSTTLVIPAYAEIQNDPQSISRSLRGVIRNTGLITGPLCVAAVLYGDLVMSALYSDPYRGVGLVFGLLFIASTLRNLSVPFSAICFATARLRPLWMVSGWRAVVVLAAIYPATRAFGMLGVALCILVSAVVAYILQIPALRGLVGPEGARSLGEIWRGGVFSIPVVLAYPLVRHASALGSIAGASAAALAVVACYVCYGLYFRYRASHKTGTS